MLHVFPISFHRLSTIVSVFPRTLARDTTILGYDVPAGVS